MLPINCKWIHRFLFAVLWDLCSIPSSGECSHPNLSTPCSECRHRASTGGCGENCLSIGGYNAVTFPPLTGHVPSSEQHGQLLKL